MSDELERLLRRGREALPRPTGAATREAHRRATAALASGSRPPPTRARLAVAAALAVAVGAGVAVGVLLAPGGTAAHQPGGVGFLPAPGWNVYQAGTRASAARPSYAVAANVPLHAQDTPGGRPSPLPLGTLQGLPPGGIVLVATVTLASEQRPLAPYGPSFPVRTLPLDLDDADPYDIFSADVRPERPLGQRVLRGTLGRYAVAVNVFFGTRVPPAAQLAAAQRQLDRFVAAAPEREPQARLARPAGWVVPAARPEAARGAVRVLDRTFRCSVPRYYGGVRRLELRATSGFRDAGRFRWLGSVSFSSRQLARRAEDRYVDLGGITAGWPPPPGLQSGGLAVSLDRCAPASARPTLTHRDLVGGSADVFGDGYACATGSTVVVRVRAEFAAPAEVDVRRRGRSRGLVAEARVLKGSWVAATPAGKRLGFGQVLDSGRARLYHARGCQQASE